MEDWLSIYVEDVSDVFGSRAYTVSGYDGTGHSPFDTLQFDTKKEAVSFARETRRAEKDAIARGYVPYHRVEILIDGDLL
jgi:hypothetical protein